MRKIKSQVQSSQTVEQKVKFLEITKPIRMRRYKLFLLKIKSLRTLITKDKIEYIYNYILFRLGILKRETYNDSISEALSIPQVCKVIETKHFFGTLKTSAFRDILINKDYFYFLKKNGEKVITYILCDSYTSRYYSITDFVEPGIIIDGHKYQYGCVPQVVRSFTRPKIPNAYDRNLSFLGSFDSSVVEYDLGPLLKLHVKLGLEENIKCLDRVSEVTYDMFKYKLGNMSLRDLEV